MYPDLASVETIGTSYEGRPLRVLTISQGGSSRPGVFIDAGIHAAEWFGPSTALYAVQQLTEFAAQNQEMLDLADWHILVVANPDGYTFSWSDVSNSDVTTK
jgi:murein tripeptide amidase MpaA